MGGSGTPYDPNASKSGKTSDRVFQSSEDEVKRTIEHQRNVFISFDVDDEGMVNLLRSQAKDDRFQFGFRDYSVKEPFDSAWKSKVRDRIDQTSAVIVAIGENTHKSKAVDWEIREAHRQGKLIIGMRLHSDKSHIVPQAMKEYGDKVIYWDTKTLGKMLE